MSNLTGKEIKDSYKDLLQMGNANTGVTSTLESVKDGEGSVSTLKLSTTSTEIDNLAVTSELVAQDGASISGVTDIADANISGRLTIGSGVELRESVHRADLLEIKSLTSGWGGIQITNNTDEHLFSLMSDGNAFGLYDDQQNEWAWQYQENGHHILYNNGAVIQRTTDAGIRIYPQSGKTIGGNDLSQATLLIGSSTAGIGIDDNEITKKQGTDGGTLHIGSVGSASAINFQTGADSDGKPIRRMYINSSGDVGIGTDSPEGKLEINHTGSWNDPSIHLKGDLPTIKFNDTNTNQDDWYIHVNNNNFNVLCDRGASGGDDPIDTADNIWDTPTALQLEGDTNTGYLFGEVIATTDMFSFNASTQTLTINM
jgi:hypothetical protein